MQQLRTGDQAATARLHKYKLNVAEPMLADAQFVLAREHGFDSWPKLVHYIQAAHPPGLEQHCRIAEDLVAAYNSADPEAARRLNDLFHSTLNIDQIRDFIRDKLLSLPETQGRLDNFTLSDAQLVVAQLYGFKDWIEFVESSSEPASDLHSAPIVLSSKPPLSD